MIKVPVRCRESIFSFIGRLVVRKQNGKHCDVAEVAAVVLDPDDAPDMVELGRAWPCPYPGSRSKLGFGTSSSGVKAQLYGNASNSDGRNGESADLQRSGAWVNNFGLKCTSNVSALSSLSCASVLFLSF